MSLKSKIVLLVVGSLSLFSCEPPSPQTPTLKRATKRGIAECQPNKSNTWVRASQADVPESCYAPSAMLPYSLHCNDVAPRQCDELRSSLDPEEASCLSCYESPDERCYFSGDTKGELVCTVEFYEECEDLKTAILKSPPAAIKNRSVNRIYCVDLDGSSALSSRNQTPPTEQNKPKQPINEEAIALKKAEEEARLKADQEAQKAREEQKRREAEEATANEAKKREARKVEREKEACSYANAIEEIEDTGVKDVATRYQAKDPTIVESIKKRYQACVDRRVALCQLEVDSGDLSKAQKCWQQWPWEESRITTYENGTYSGFRIYPSEGHNPEKLLPCLEQAQRERDELASCTGLPEKTDQEQETKVRCIKTFQSQPLTNACGPLNLDGYVAGYKKTLVPDATVAALELKLAPSRCQSSLEEIDRLNQAIKFNDARNMLTKAADYCLTKSEKTKLTEAEQKIIKAEEDYNKQAEEKKKQAEKCGALDVMSLIIAIQYRSYDASKAVGCEYSSSFGKIMYETKDGYLILAYDKYAAALKTSESFATGATIKGRRFKLTGLKKFETPDGTKVTLPTFKLLPK